MSREGTVAAIDVGTTKVCTAVAEPLAEGGLRILGVGITPSAGLAKGMVDNIHEATQAITDAVQKAERSSGLHILSAYVSIAGHHIQSLTQRGTITLPGQLRPIARADAERAQAVAEGSVDLPQSRQILHVLPRYYLVDGQDRVRNPLGMYGQRLDVETHVVTGAVSAIQNLRRCVEGAGVEVAGLVLAPLASAQAVLEEEERREGVILADIGGGTTDIAVFFDGALHHTAGLQVGGNHLTHDLVVGLRAPFNAAEALKALYGQATTHGVDSEEEIEFEAFGSQRRKAASRRRLCEILQFRAEEILEMILAEVKRAGYLERVAAGLVLTGGTAKLRALEVLAEEVLRLPARAASPKGLSGLSEMLSGPAYATSVGLLQWAAREAVAAPVPIARRLSLPLGSWLTGFGRWARGLLPQ